MVTLLAIACATWRTIELLTLRLVTALAVPIVTVALEAIPVELVPPSPYTVRWRTVALSVTGVATELDAVVRPTAGPAPAGITIRTSSIVTDPVPLTYTPLRAVIRARERAPPPPSTAPVAF